MDLNGAEYCISALVFASGTAASFHAASPSDTNTPARAAQGQSGSGLVTIENFKKISVEVLEIVLEIQQQTNPSLYACIHSCIPH